MKKPGLTLANRITIVRILLITPFIIALLEDAYGIALGLGVAMFVSDAADGWIARRYQQKTRLGTFLDPLADKLLLLSTFGALAHKDVLPEWVFVIVASKDVVVSLGWALMFVLEKTTEPTTRPLGKLATAVQMGFATFVLLGLALGLEGGFWSVLLSFLRIAMIALTLASLLDYLRLGSQRLTKD